MIDDMLSLKSQTGAAWLAQVDQDLESVLIDHAHCEKKAAGTAMSLIVAYVEHEQLCRDMTEIVNEELEHFHMVLAILRRAGLRFGATSPAPTAGDCTPTSESTSRSGPSIDCSSPG